MINHKWNKNSRFKFDKKFSKENLYKLYIIQQKSTVKIAKELNCSDSMIYNRLKYYKIKIRTMKEGVNLVNIPKLKIHKKWLNQKYNIKKLSTRQIAKILQCSIPTIRKYFKRFQIKFRTLSKSIKNSYTKELRSIRSINFGGTGVPYENNSYPLDFYTIKKSIRKRDNYICQICKNEGNEVHHIDYSKQNCSKDNLITLCRKCHAKTNFNRNYWQDYLGRLKWK